MTLVVMNNIIEHDISLRHYVRKEHLHPKHCTVSLPQIEIQKTPLLLRDQPQKSGRVP